jgi:anti-anti-sigma regulatory factor
MVELGYGWQVHVDEGPDWLFFRLLATSFEAEPPRPLAEVLWATASERGKNRLVLELADQALLTSYVVGQLAVLHKRTTLDGGVLRLCGMSDENYRVIQIMRLADRFPNYRTREAAVMGWQPPNHPR